MTTPTHVLMSDGTTVELTREPHGWRANHDGILIHVSAIQTSVAATPSHARWMDA